MIVQGKSEKFMFYFEVSSDKSSLKTKLHAFENLHLVHFLEGSSSK